MSGNAAKVPKKNPVEWAVFAAGLLLSLGTMGYLAWEAITAADMPAALTVSVDPSKAKREAESGFRVPVVVENHGAETAESVRVVLTVDGEPAAELEFDFVPHGSRRDGVAFVAADPASAVVRARVVSFRKP